MRGWKNILTNTQTCKSLVCDKDLHVIAESIMFVRNARMKWIWIDILPNTNTENYEISFKIEMKNLKGLCICQKMKGLKAENKPQLFFKKLDVLNI